MKTVSHKIAINVLRVDAFSTVFILCLCALSITLRFDGSLPYLTTLIGALQIVTGVVLSSYFKKSTVENSKGGIVYEKAMLQKEEGEIV